MNTISILLQSRDKFAHHTALIVGGSTFSYVELTDLAARYAARLYQCGIRPGDRVALYLPNGAAFVAGYHAAHWIGAIAVSIGAAAQPDEVAHALLDSGAAALLTTRAFARTLTPASTADRAIMCEDADDCSEHGGGALPVPDVATVGPDDPAAIVYSSGTTGQPKGVVLSHANVQFVARAKVKYMGILHDDRLLLFLPLHHCFGQNAVMLPALAAGATLVMLPRFEPNPVLAALERERITMMFGVPSTFLALFDRLQPHHVETIRYWFCAAASLPRALEARWHQRFGRPIHQGYGLSESSPFASYNHLDGPRVGTVGTPIEGVEMGIMDPHGGAAIPIGEPGEIVIRGPNVMLGYWDRPAETDRAIRDGWLHTGDIGRMDEDGYFTVEDRVTDMINIGGENVYPAEVENAIYAHPGVLEVAVFGVAEPYLGEEVRARVVARDGHALTLAEILAVCRARLAPFKVPAMVEFADDLPKSPTGKVLKRVLKEEAAATLALGGEGARDGEGVEDFVRDWLSERLGLRHDGFDPARPFVDYGLDSALGVALARDLGTFLEADLEPTLVWEFPSLNMLTDGLAERHLGRQD